MTAGDFRQDSNRPRLLKIAQYMGANLTRDGEFNAF
jgi:hypothetical protein